MYKSIQYPKVFKIKIYRKNYKIYNKTKKNFSVIIKFFKFIFL